MIKDENKSISKKQLLDDVRDLELENKPTPESLQGDLKRAAQGLDSEKQIDNALDGILDQVSRTGTSLTDEEKVTQLDAFQYRGFFIQVFKFQGAYFGWAREVHPLITSTTIEFEAKDYPTAFSCGQQLVRLVNILRKRKRV